MSPSSKKLLLEEAKRRGLTLQTRQKAETYLEWYRSTLPATWGVPPHIEYLCSLAQRVIDGDIKRLAISTPPGHTKSDTITRRVPIYWGTRHPKTAIVQTGYSQRFAEKNLSYPTRELARELGVLAASSTAMDEWEFTSGARLIARGVGSAPTGVNPISLLVADDPTKDRAQAESEVWRENVWQWWQGSIVQRFWPETRAIVIATRWHHDDLIGRLKERDPEGWTFVNLPAIAKDEDPIGRAPGEALWPGGKPIEFLEQQRLEMGDYEFQALFQGEPTPREGAMFKVDRIEWDDQAPAGTVWVRAWDMAATAGGGDYTAGVKLGRDPSGRFWFGDVVRGQWSSDERNRIIRTTAETDGRDVQIRGPQDPGAAGKEAAMAFTRLLSGFSVKTAPVTGDKQLRADPLSAQLNAGNTTMVRAPWNAALVEELRQFPMGSHDDQVDAASDAFAALSKPKQQWQIY